VAFSAQDQGIVMRAGLRPSLINVYLRACKFAIGRVFEPALRRIPKHYRYRDISYQLLKVNDLLGV
jgi:hypothetical protein